MAINTPRHKNFEGLNQLDLLHIFHELLNKLMSSLNSKHRTQLVFGLSEQRLSRDGIHPGQGDDHPDRVRVDQVVHQGLRKPQLLSQETQLRLTCHLHPRSQQLAPMFTLTQLLQLAREGEDVPKAKLNAALSWNFPSTPAST